MGKKLDNRSAKKIVKKNINLKSIALFTSIIAVIILLISIIVVNLNKEETYVTINNTELSETEYSFYYTLSVNNYLYQYNDYLEYLGLDETKSFSEQYIDEDTTWEDYFREMTNSLVQSSIVLYNDAKTNKYDAKNNVFYTEFIANIKMAAKENNTTYEKYIKDVFGENMTSKIFEEQLLIYSTAINYSEYLMQNFETKVTDEEISALYTSQPEEYETVYYRAFIMPYSTTATKDDFEKEIITKDTAVALANKVNTAQNLDEFIAFSHENCLESYKDLYVGEEAGYSYVTSKSSLNEALQDWLYSNDRVKGDIKLIDDEDSSMVFVLYFEERKLVTDQTVNFRYITLTLDSYKTEDNLKKQAEGMYNLWVEAGATEEEFITYANTYSENSAENGLCENISPGELETEIDAWLFDKSRKEGDHKLFYVGDNYHIFYYIEKDEPYYCAVIREEIASEQYTAYMHKLLENNTLKFADGSIYDSMDSHTSTEISTEENTEK